MGFKTKAFDLFYKRLGPTGSYTTSPYSYSGSIVQNWFSSSSLNVSSSFLNFPKDQGTSTTTYASTDNKVANARFRALPWASHACDMLWNVTVPSWSYVDVTTSQVGIYGPTQDITDRTWTVNMQTSKSFYRNAVVGGTSFGVSQYNITSSWTIVDSKLITGSFGSGSASFGYVHNLAESGAPYPVFIGSRYDSIQTEKSNQVAYDITYPTASNNSTSSFDGQYFDVGGGAGITRTNISRSLVVQQVSGSFTVNAAITACTRALKNRRLFFPTTVSGSGTTLGTDYWFRQNTGYKSSELFNENGGIYNVQLTLKKSATLNDYYPNNNSYLSVFIHNVNTNIPLPAARIAGADGWYPPDNNIVRIGNAYGESPIMTFSDVQTGYRIEKFNFNVIQYGYPAQLCIEASGSLADGNYFGIIVDDIHICKIGVTTDPRFIKPTTIAQSVSNIRDANIEPPAIPIE